MNVLALRYKKEHKMPILNIGWSKIFLERAIVRLGEFNLTIFAQMIWFS